MSPLHAALVAYIREAISDDGGELDAKLSPLSDEQIVRLMFSNFRGRENARGLRLSKVGLAVMQRFFRGYEIPPPKGQRLGLASSHLLYLDSRATMPYYCSTESLVVYDHVLGVKLRLADGDIGTLLEIEGEP